MATFNTDNTANFADFRRYHSGEMTDREQHTFEKKLLADPAFAEAYEGFVLMQEMDLDSAKIGDEIYKKLQGRVGKKEGRRIAFQLYAAAATVLLVLGASWLVFDRNIDEEVTPEVSTRAPEVKAAPDAEIAPNQEAASEDREVASVKSQPRRAPASPEPDFKSLPRTAFAAPEGNSIPTVVPAQRDSNEDAFAADAAEERIATAEPVPSAFPAASQLSEEMRAQLKRPQVASHNSTRLVSRGLPDGRGAQAAKHAAIGADRVAFDSADDTQYVAKKGDSLRVALVGSGQPEGGWPAFQAYLNKNVLISKDSTTVQVEFIVRADGSLSDFKVSGPAVLRDRAIQIIRQGPSWKPAAGKGASADAPVRVFLRVRSVK